MLCFERLLLCSAFAFSIGCSGTNMPNPDGGADVTGTDSPTSDGSLDGMGNDVATDTNTVVDAGNDTATAPDAPADTGSNPDSALTCSAGVECTNYAAVLAAAPRGATSLSNCVVQLHRADCCGATHAYGANHAARTTLCPAETACVAMYPTPAGCSDSTITTDSGETTSVMANVKLRVVDPTPCSFDPSMTCYTCQTFVCTGGSCSSAPGIAGGCGP